MIVRALALVGIGFILLLVQSTLHHLLPVERATLDLALPLLLAMGLSDTPPAWGAPVAFVIGYMADSFSGSPMGVLTIVAVGTFLAGHLASVRLFIEGIPFQVVLTFLASLVSSATIVVLRVLFDRAWDGGSVAWIDVLVRAAMTAAVAPLVFTAVGRLLPRRTEEAAA